MSFNYSKSVDELDNNSMNENTESNFKLDMKNLIFLIEKYLTISNDSFIQKQLIFLKPTNIELFDGNKKNINSLNIDIIKTNTPKKLKLATDKIKTNTPKKSKLATDKIKKSDFDNYQILINKCRKIENQSKLKIHSRY
uniref:Uncharacterized protein n=1 Tax=viral metagenome TaxID=1070528 RepID=A0A6C0EDA0_9ZZZZ